MPNTATAQLCLLSVYVGELVSVYTFVYVIPFPTWFLQKFLENSGSLFL